MQFDYMLVVTALKIALNFTVQLGFGCVSVRTGNASLPPLLGEAEESIGSFCTRTPHHPTDDLAHTNPKLNLTTIELIIK